eukprot:358752-Chlamydomonas_euryale.AAC.30
MAFSRASSAAGEKARVCTAHVHGGASHKSTPPSMSGSLQLILYLRYIKQAGSILWAAQHQKSREIGRQTPRTGSSRRRRSRGLTPSWDAALYFEVVVSLFSSPLSPMRSHGRAGMIGATLGFGRALPAALVGSLAAPSGAPPSPHRCSTSSPSAAS